MATTWIVDRARYQQLAAQAEPAAVITTKDSAWWFVLWLALCILTLGLICIKMPWRKFHDDYATTIGPWQGYPSAILELSPPLLVHEARHTTQAVTLGWLVPVVGWFFGRRARAVAGLLPMALVYGLLPVPVLGALGRFYLELDADRAAWRWMLSRGYTAEQVLARASSFGQKVCGGEYLWALIGGAGLFTKEALKVVGVIPSKP